MKPVVVSLLAISAGIAVVLAVGQNRFAPSSFEFGTFRPYTGTLEDWPVPLLSVGSSQYLLVGAGKHGVADVVKGLSGRVAALEGSLIHRGPYKMLELLPGSLRAQDSTGQPNSRVSKGQAQFTGEVVDTKCYLGVMNPGESKVHRACAARCISGGAPAALAVDGRLLLLVGVDGRPIHREILPFAGERVIARGEWIQAGNLEVLRLSASDIRRE